MISHHVAVKCDIFRPKNVIFKGVLDVVFNSCEAWLQCILTKGDSWFDFRLYDRNVNSFLRCYGDAFSYIGSITRKLWLLLIRNWYPSFGNSWLQLTNITLQCSIFDGSWVMLISGEIYITSLKFYNYEHNSRSIWYSLWRISSVTYFSNSIFC